MNSNKKLVGFRPLLFVIAAFGVALFGLSSVAWGAITVTATFEDVDDEAELACLSLGGPYTYVDLSDLTDTEVANGRKLVITIAADADMTSGETITIALPSTDLQWGTPTGTGGSDWFTDTATYVGGGSLTLVRTDAQTLTFTAPGNKNDGVGSTITLDVLEVRVASTVTSAVATAQVNLSGTADVAPDPGDCGNIVIIVGPSVSFDDPVAGADTTSGNGYSGLSYGTQADYVCDASVATFYLWVSDDSSLVDVSEGAARMLDANNDPIAAIAEAADFSQTVYTKSLPEGTYYIYTTSASTAPVLYTGTVRVGRSDALVVTHQPYGSAVSPSADYYLDSGGLYATDGTMDGSGVDNTDVFFTVVDYDDNAAIRLYYGPSGLTDSDVTTSGSAEDTTLAVTGLGSATLVTYSDTLCDNEDTFFNWDVQTDDTTYVTASDYKMYAVACDGKHYDVLASTKEFYVRHSPSITVDVLDDDTPDTDEQRYVTISWGQTGVDGDKDIDNSGTISLYYNDEDMATGGWDVGSATAFLADAETELIVSGIAEDPDGRTDNQYVWDLWTYTGTLPAAGTWYIYAVISDGESTPTQYLGGGALTNDVTFTHGAWARLKNPVDAGSTVNEGESYRFNWEDVELDATGYVKLILVSDGTDGLVTAAGAVDYLDIDGEATDAYVVCSSDGSWASGDGPTEDSATDYYDFKPEWLQGDAGEVGTGLTAFTDDTYYVYLCLSTTDATTEPADADLIFKAPGTLTIGGMASSPVAYGLEMSPTDAVAAAGDTVTFSIYPYANAQTIKTAYVYISADTTYWSVVDQAATSGTQPFALNTGSYGGSELENDTHGDDVSDGLHHLDFTYSDNTGAFTATSDGVTVLATFQLVCRGVSGGNEADTYVNFDQVSGRETAFYDGMDQKVCSVPMPAAMAKVIRRGTIAGRVPLQGRESDYSKEITFSLRKKGSFEPITDAAYVDSNDTNLDVAGVQITTGVDGSFEFVEVPCGMYTLVVHTDGYLDGQLQDISVDPGDHLTGQDPTYDATPTDQGKLLGGDCAGYTDTTGATIPDNEINTTDEQAVNNVFDSYVTDPSDTNYVKDIDGDGHIYTSDLNMVTGNSGKDGVAPVYKPVPGDNAGASFSVVTLGHVEVGEVFDVVVRSEQIADVRAYAVRLQYDGLRLMGVTEGPFLRNAAPAAFVIRDRGREVVIAGAIRGRMHTARADDEVAVLRFESRKSGAPVVRLSEAEVFDSGDRRTTMRFAAQVPERFAVSKAFPNPFNPTVTLSIQLVEETEVSLNVFDVLGRKVATVEAGRMNAGFHKISWDGRNNAGRAVASGLYFFAVDAGTYREVRKAALLR